MTALAAVSWALVFGVAVAALVLGRGRQRAAAAGFVVMLLAIAAIIVAWWLR